MCIRLIKALRLPGLLRQKLHSSGINRNPPGVDCYAVVLQVFPRLGYVAADQDIKATTSPALIRQSYCTGHDVKSESRHEERLRSSRTGIVIGG